MTGTLGLGPEDFRVVGLALAEFAAGRSTDPQNDTDREHAQGLLDQLTSWGFIPRAQDS